MAWSDVINQGNSNQSEEVKYVKFPIGITKLRILDEQPFSRWTHWIPQANNGKGMSVNCLGKGCPVCKAMAEDKKANRKKRYNASKSHALNVFVHETKVNGQVTPVKEVQILDKGNGIFGGLYAIFEQMGDLRNYDVTVTRVGENLGDIKYTILPVYPPSELSQQDKQIASIKYDVEEVKKSFTAEEIETLLSGGTIQKENTESSNTSENTIPNVDFSEPFQQ